MSVFFDHYMEAGSRARQRGDFRAAAEAYRQALAIAPGDPQLLGLLGAALLEGGEAGQALPHLQQAAAKARRNAGLTGALAQALFELGRFDEAAAAFRQAQRLAPAQPGFMLGAANSLAMQGKFTEARPLLERVVARFPHHALAWFNLGNVLRDCGELGPAADAFRKALALDPGFLDARNGLGRTLHAAQRFDEAAQEYARCVREAPQFLAAHMNLTSVLIDQGQFDQAEAACKTLIDMAPGDAQAQALLADTFNARGRMLDAAHHYGVAVRLAGLVGGLIRACRHRPAILRPGVGCGRGLFRGRSSMHAHAVGSGEFAVRFTWPTSFQTQIEGGVQSRLPKGAIRRRCPIHLPVQVSRSRFGSNRLLIPATVSPSSVPRSHRTARPLFHGPSSMPRPAESEQCCSPAA